MKKIATLIGVTLALGCTAAMSADRAADTVRAEPATQRQSPAAPDNTGTNVRDKSGVTQTPQKQANAAGDRKLLAAVRRAVIGDKALSTSAHNIKIMTSEGVVTLRGPVGSEKEKGRIGELVTQVAGVSSVENQLDIKSK